MKAKANTSSRLLKYSAIAGSATLAGVAPAAISVYDNGGAGWTVPVNNGLTFDIDGNINQPGADFSLTNYRSTYSLRAVRRLVFSNRIRGSRLNSGVLINGSLTPNNFFQTFTYTGSNYNNWSQSGPSSSGYVGLEFTDGVNVNYGWADITINANGPGQTIVMNRYAVEMTPNVGILAGAVTVIPETSTLVLAVLALGAAGVFSIRRQKN